MMDIKITIVLLDICASWFTIDLTTFSLLNFDGIKCSTGFDSLEVVTFLASTRGELVKLNKSTIVVKTVVV